MYCNVNVCVFFCHAYPSFSIGPTLCSNGHNSTYEVGDFSGRENGGGAGKGGHRI